MDVDNAINISKELIVKIIEGVYIVYKKQMQFNTSMDSNLKEVWELIIKKMNQDGEEVCPNASSFYRTQDGIECSLRSIHGDLIAICYRENNRNGGYRWTIQKSI